VVVSESITPQLVLRWCVEWCRGRVAPGKRLYSVQVIRHKLAGRAKEEEVSRAALEEDRETLGIWRAVAGGHRWGDQI
jgi:alkylation response protein AidB-like acyl-CoA dehydrogenase